MHRQRQFDARFRRTALASLVLFFIGSITSSLHMALVRHAVCPEHGEVVHVGAAVAPSSCTPRAHAAHGRVWSPESGPTDDAHDDCSIAAQSRVRDVAWTPTSTVVRSAPERLVQDCAPGPVRTPAFSRLFLAPKHSPPV